MSFSLSVFGSRIWAFQPAVLRWMRPGKPAGSGLLVAGGLSIIQLARTESSRTEQSDIILKSLHCLSRDWLPRGFQQPSIFFQTHSQLPRPTLRSLVAARAPQAAPARPQRRSSCSSKWALGC